MGPLQNLEQYHPSCPLPWPMKSMSQFDPWFLVSPSLTQSMSFENQRINLFSEGSAVSFQPCSVGQWGIWFVLQVSLSFQWSHMANAPWRFPSHSLTTHLFRTIQYPLLTLCVSGLSSTLEFNGEQRLLDSSVYPLTHQCLPKQA